MKFLNEIDGARLVKQDSNNRFVTDAEKSNWNSKGVVDLGVFSDEHELIPHVLVNQLPTGQYAFLMNDYSYLMLLRDWGSYYKGVFQDNQGKYVFFEVTKTGVINELLERDMRDLGIIDLLVDAYETLDMRVLTDVPANAKFTDTVYTHPSSHPASIITESATKRFVTDVEKTNWDNVANKVDKVAGKDLSTEDYTTEEKQKLEGIEQNANHTSNLTLNELTLGGRFKMVYNDIEDSLDFEVI